MNQDFFQLLTTFLWFMTFPRDRSTLHVMLKVDSNMEVAYTGHKVSFVSTTYMPQNAKNDLEIVRKMADRDL